MKVLVHARDPGLRGDLVSAVRCAGHQADAADSLPGLAARVHECAADVAIVDLADPSAAPALRELREALPGVALLAVGHEHGPAAALEALRAGARGFLRKPFDVGRLERALAAAAHPDRPAIPSQELIAEDPSGRALADRLARAAASDATVLLHGEGGSGRTRCAEWIHRSSRRRSATAVFVACTDLQGPDGAALLLGRESARRRRSVGRVEAAHRGTLVLEDVDELPLDLQAEVLAVLQERCVRSVAGVAALPIDVRVVASTRRDLAAEAEAGRFLPDLLDRLDVLGVRVPPLRERPGDVAPLARHFLERFAAVSGDPPARLDDTGCAELVARAFPGNVRELENLMRRAALLFPGEPVRVAEIDGPLGAPREAASTPLRGFDLRELERETIQRSLRATRGNRTAAARALGISVRTLRNKIRRYDLA